jgi:hypothetical protein
VLAERGKPTMALMVDSENNYLGGREGLGGFSTFQDGFMRQRRPAQRARPGRDPRRHSGSGGHAKRGWFSHTKRSPLQIGQAPANFETFCLRI